MKGDKKVFIHIGYPKTATTTLQNHLFSNLTRFDLIGQPITKENEDVQKIIHTITDCETLDYNADDLRERIERCVSDDKQLLISEESLSTGSSLSGRVSRSEIAYRLKSLFPNAKIIVILREQKSIIKSFYLQKKKIDKNFKVDFNDWFESNKNNQHKENVFQYLYYEKLIELYDKLFGEENIKILLFEDFKYNLTPFVRELTDFLGEDFDSDKLGRKHDNKTVTGATLMLRTMNEKYSFIKRLVPKRLKHFLKCKAQNGKVMKVELNEQQIHYINSVYSDTNKVLSKRYGLNLKDYGYYYVK